MAHGDAREGKWRGNWRMQWVASTLHTTSEHGVSSITTADAHTSAVSSRLNWLPPPIKIDSSVSPKDEIWFLRMCHHISNAVYKRPRYSRRCMNYGNTCTVKVKQSRYRPGGAQRVPGSKGSQISWQRHRIVVGCQPYTRVAFAPRKCSWYSFLLDAASTPGP